jgi:dienelactone hydrolase
VRPGRLSAGTFLLLGAAVLGLAACGRNTPAPQEAVHTDGTTLQERANPNLESLADLSLETLRSRTYRATLQPELNLALSASGPAYRNHFSRDGSDPYDSYVVSYESDGNRVYARIDLPARAAPASGYPVLIFVHGWIGREAAPGFDFMYTPESLYSRYIDAFVDAGFVVLSPALRGHGTVNGVPAGGIGFLDAWDNASYLSPVFYAVDVLNLLEGIQSLETVDWTAWGHAEPVRIDIGRINITGQSQGADAVLTALAVSGEGSAVRNTLARGSLWSGCFGPRLEQAAIYGPMAATLEAFVSGDGSWTGSAAGVDGHVNPNFVFGWPPDWIGTVDTASPEWTWQPGTWSVPTVAEVLQTRHAEMYRVINEQIGDIGDATFTLVTDAGGRVSVMHDPRILSAMQAIDAYDHPEWLSEPLHLHHSDQDYYSIPRWNVDLASRINALGNHAANYLYPRNTHSLLASRHRWFSPGETVSGLPYMIQRDLALFGGADPAGVTRQADEPLSIGAIRRYAAAVRNEFQTEFERIPLDGMARRVVSFRADGLKQYALVLEPAGQPPASGWPVLLLNHGHHPNPPDYGRIADGSTDRPGDYYREVPPAFARHGFLVVMPDFRGHNDSEGVGYAHGLLESYWYTRDAIAAFRALGSLPSADTTNVFMWGHSMGGSVTLRALLALGDEVRGASIWSSSSAGLWDKAANYAIRPNSGEQSATDYRESLVAQIGALPFDFDPAQADPTEFLQELRTPLNLHHATGDPVTPYAWSDSVAAAMSDLNRSATLYTYPSNDHLLVGSELIQAIDRDAALFKRHMQ